MYLHLYDIGKVGKQARSRGEGRDKRRVNKRSMRSDKYKNEGYMKIWM